MSQPAEKKPDQPATQKPAWKRWLGKAFKNLVLPLGVKPVFVYLAAWFVAWPLLGATVFPRAEKAVAEQGLDPKIVSELAPGKNVYIRTDDFLGKAHALFDRGPLATPLVWLQNLGNGVEGGSTRNQLLTANTLGVCMVYMHKSGYKDEAPWHYQRALLHEIAHCSNDNVKLLNYGLYDNVATEGDADARALTVLARETKNPAVKQAVLNSLAVDGVSFGPTHDTALYLDAVFNNRAIPSNEAIVAANAEAETVRKPLIDRQTARAMSDDLVKQGFPSLCETSEVFKKDCDYDLASAHLSPLGQRRAELYATGLKAELFYTFGSENRPTVQNPRGLPKKPGA